MTTITTPRTLLEQSLESMCWAARILNIDLDEAPNYHRSLENIRAALAAPATAPDPVATWLGTDYEAHKQCFAQLAGLEPGTDLYTIPPATAPEQHNAPETLALKAELDAAMKDAGRYRWLRKQHWSEGPFAVVARPKENVMLGAKAPSHEFLDAAIDAAMKGTP